MAFLFPDYYYKSAYMVPYEKLYEKGIRGVIFDIDNTLVCHGAPADERSLALLKRLKEIGFSVCFLSNNKEPRVKSFNEKVGAVYIFKAGKPKKEGYIKACEKMGTNVANTVFVGDQIFTDICGANAAHIKNFLVRQIGPKEEIQIVLKRILEKPILAAFRVFCNKRCKLKSDV